MTPVLIIVFILLLLTLGYLKLKGNERNKELQRTISIHEYLGYPKLHEEDQFNILVNFDVSSIRELSPELEGQEIPFSILKKYITISKADFKALMKRKNFLDKHKLENAPNPGHDGIWWTGETIIDQERGYIHQKWEASNEDEALNIYVNILWEKVNLK